MKHPFLLFLTLQALMLQGCQQLKPAQERLAAKLPPSAERLAQAAGLRIAPPPPLQNRVLVTELMHSLLAAVVLTGEISEAPGFVTEHQLLLHVPADPAVALQPVPGWRLERSDSEQMVYLIVPGSTPDAPAIQVVGSSLKADGNAARLGHRVRADFSVAAAGSATAPPTVSFFKEWLAHKAIQSTIGYFLLAHDRFPASWEEALLATAQAPVGYIWLPAATTSLPAQLPAGISLAFHPGRQLVGKFTSTGTGIRTEAMEFTWSDTSGFNVKSAAAAAGLPTSEWIWWGTMQFPE